MLDDDGDLTRSLPRPSASLAARTETRDKGAYRVRRINRRDRTVPTLSCFCVVWPRWDEAGGQRDRCEYRVRGLVGVSRAALRGSIGCAVGIEEGWGMVRLNVIALLQTMALRLCERRLCGVRFCQK